MATKFIILAQVHRPKTTITTRKPPRCNQNKPRQSKSNMLNTVFPDKTLTKIYHDSLDSHPLTNSLLFVEDQLVEEEEEETSPQSNSNHGKSRESKYRDLRREVARLSLLWYMRCSISYILRKARAFYNEFSCDTYAGSSTMAVVDPYFSVPVLPV